MKSRLIKALLFLFFTLILVNTLANNPLSKTNLAKASPTTTFYVDPPSIIDQSLTPGSSFTVNVNVSDAVDVFAWQIRMNFDTAVLDAINIILGDFLAGQPYGATPSWRISNPGGFVIVGQTTNQAPVGEPPVPGVDGDGWLCSITFSVEILGETALDIDNIYTFALDKNLNDITIVRENGFFSNIAAAPQYDLTISVDGSGSTVPAVGVHTYDEDTPVEVTAFPDGGWLFDHWVLDTVDVGSANPIVVVMDADHALTAYFVEEVPTVSVTVDIRPETLNLRSKGKWITCYITLPEGYNVSDIDISTIYLDEDIAAEWGEVQGNVLMVKFDRSEVTQYILNVMGIAEGEVTLTLTGSLSGGVSFEGSDTIRVMAKEPKP